MTILLGEVLSVLILDMKGMHISRVAVVHSGSSLLLALLSKGLLAPVWLC